MSEKISYEAVNNCFYDVGIVRIPQNGFDDRSYNDIDFFAVSLQSNTLKFTIFDSLDMFFRTAEMVLYDRECLREYIPLTGNEIISIRYRNLLHDASTPEKIYHFFIVNIFEEQNEREWDRGSTFIRLILVEAPIYHFLTTNEIYKTYKWDGGSKNKYPDRQCVISDIFKDITKLIPGFEKWYNIDIEDTLSNEKNKINFYIPNWTPYKTINYLKKFAISSKGYPYYVCYIEPPEKLGEKPTFHIVSLYSLIEKSKTHQFSGHYANQTYRNPTGNEQPARDIKKEPDFFDLTNVFYRRKIHYFNRIKTSFSKMSGETFFTFDYIKDNKYVSTSFEKFIEEYKSGTGLYFIHGMKYGNIWSKFRPHSFTEEQRLLNMKKNEYSYETVHSAIGGIFSMPVNNNRRVGHMADILIKSPMKDVFVDSMFSGKWLLWGQIDSLSTPNGPASSLVYCLQDSFSNLQEVPKGIKKVTPIIQ